MTKGFRAGTYRLHPEANMNYCLNRIFAINGGGLEEIRATAKRIKTHDDWISEFKALAERALAEGRLQEGAAYVRAAQFFMSGADPEKRQWYERYVTLARELHAEEFEGGFIKEERVPYLGGYLPVWRGGSAGEGTLRRIAVMSLGFDSVKEELIPLFRLFREAGIGLLLFEGPGMGEPLYRSGLTMSPDSDRPLKAVLDHFGLDDVTLIGLSLGGFLAPRAAALEPRVRRVVSWGVMYDFYDTLVSRRGPLLESLLRAFMAMRLSPAVNLAARILMGWDSFSRWGLEQGMLVFGSRSPYGFLAGARNYTLKSVPDLGGRDFLLLDSADDHFIPERQFAQVAAKMKRARSFTARIFTREELAENHVGFGNANAVVGLILRWIAAMEEEAANGCQEG